jgi:hypothetical protein
MQVNSARLEHTAAKISTPFDPASVKIVDLIGMPHAVTDGLRDYVSTYIIISSHRLLIPFHLAAGLQQPCRHRSHEGGSRRSLKGDLLTISLHDAHSRSYPHRPAAHLFDQPRRPVRTFLFPMRRPRTHVCLCAGPHTPIFVCAHPAHPHLSMRGRTPYSSLHGRDSPSVT